MFNIEMYPEIIMHLKTISSRFHKHSSGWYEIFCPYCNDATRKLNPSHGHFHIASSYPFGHCFRCNTQIGLHRLLIDTNFHNIDIIKKLQQRSGFTYNKTNNIKISSKYSNIDLFNKINEQYSYFIKHKMDELNIFNEYIKNRCFEINPIDFYMIPIILNNCIGVHFLNHDGYSITTRLINSSMRYINPNQKYFYYFQNLKNLDQFKDIVITEGNFDLINLYNYSVSFKDAFYISIGGNNYKNAITEIITNYLLIGVFNIHVIFDQGLTFLEKMIYGIKTTINILNPQIKIYFYLPLLTKDVSDCILIHTI